DLVTHGAHDRDTTRRDVAHELFVVEREQVILRAASTSDDNDIHRRHLLEHPECAPDRVRGPGALHLCRSEQDPRTSATKGDLADVMDHCALRAGDDTNDARIVRQRSLPLLCEEPFCLELLLQLLERLEQRALPRGLDAIADELELAPW